MGFPYKPVAHLLGSNGPVHAVAYSASPGTYILTGSSDRAIRLYNPLSSSSSSTTAGSAAPAQAGRLIQTYSAHGYEVLSLAVAADNERFASAGGDRTVFLWDVAKAVTVRRFGTHSARGHAARVNAVALAGAGDSLVLSGGLDSRVLIWDARAGWSPHPIQALDEARDAVTGLAWHRDRCEIVAASADGRVRTYDLRRGRLVEDLVSGAGPATGVVLSRDGRSMLVASLDGAVRLMDRDTGECLRTFAAEGRRNEHLRVQALLGAGERYVVAGDEAGAAEEREDGTDDDDGRIWAWDLLSGRPIGTIPVPWGPPDGHELLLPRRKRAVGPDGRERERRRRNVVSCLAWREGGWGDQFCAGGTSGVVTVFGGA